jgi:peptidoglycan/LPS O-acetylase OafA/YrhL
VGLPDRRGDYRPDIDGLRAIAVLPVVLFHSGLPGFGGGYVGVDVFFVISGFLITSLIYEETRAGKFSIIRFYERRMRRILPALFTVIATTLIAGAFILFPRDLVQLAYSAISTVFFVANFHFWIQAGYFGGPAQLKPLLHTWSLAVEEQYYVLFPLVLYFMRARSRSFVLFALASIGLVSFGLYLWCVTHFPSTAFYLAPYRTWELMLGATLAVGEISPPKSVWLSELLAAIGLALIAGAVVALTVENRFPGDLLVPCAGASLTLYACRPGEGVVGRVLASPPLVGMGLISYSLYLWHWPVLAFARYASGSPLQAPTIALLLALDLALALASWRYVERPFRQKDRLLSGRPLFAIAGAGAAGLFAVAGSLVLLHGLPERFAPPVQLALAEADDIEPLRNVCFNRTPDRIERGDICSIGASGDMKPSFLLWGDSHADALLPAINDVAIRANRKGLYIGHGHCPPLLDVQLSDEPPAECARINASALRLALSPGISLVVLAARWDYYERGIGYGDDSDEAHQLSDVRESGLALTQRQIFARLLERTVRALVAHKKKVVLVAQVPEAGASVPEALAHAMTRNGAKDITLPYLSYQARDAEVGAAFAALRSSEPAVILVNPAQRLCARAQCELSEAGRPLYVDHQHLSIFGATTLEPLFAHVF